MLNLLNNITISLFLHSANFWFLGLILWTTKIQTLTYWAFLLRLCHPPASEDYRGCFHLFIGSFLQRKMGKGGLKLLNYENNLTKEIFFRQNYKYYESLPVKKNCPPIDFGEYLGQINHYSNTLRIPCRGSVLP